MIWWCDCGTSLGLSCYGMQMFLLHLVAYTNLRFLYSEKGAMIQLTKWQNDIWNEKEEHGLEVSNRLHLSCGVNLSYQIYGWSACCAKTATRVCDDILRSRRTSFPFECPASGVFNIGYVAQSINLEMSALFAGQKGSNVRTMFAPIFFISDSYLKYNLQGNNMPMCLIADAHSP